MADSVRVRFAPSPTGPLHIGGVRTALFNYLFAKKHNGQFVLRIEDTDQNRFVEHAEAYIVEALEWCGLSIDEGPNNPGAFGPYRQSERKDLYKDYADQLVNQGKAYYAFDTPKKLDFHRKDHEAKGKTFIYNWHNRNKLDNSLNLTKDAIEDRIASGDPYVIRFKCPENEVLHLQDIIRGKITIDTSTLDDKIIFKSDGMPTYHLANIVDDHLMEITHVIRGEEWLPSLALHQLLYDAFAWKAPQFAHLPLIMKPTGKGKLSKRDGEKGGFPIFPLQWNESPGYREDGYFPETVVNFLALLGWNPGTEQELFSLEALISEFSLEKVNKSGARFDPDKTKWFNQQYLQQKTDAELAILYKKILKTKLTDHPKVEDANYLTAVVSLIKERAAFVVDFWDLSAYFFLAPETYGEKAVKKQWKENTPQLMANAKEVISSVNDFSSENIETQIKTWIAQNDLPMGKIMAPLRLSIVGDLKGPHLFDIIALLGKDESIQRINNAIAKL